MKILLSPAKSLDFDSALPTQNYSNCAFLEQSEIIQQTLSQLSPIALAALMGLSDKLAHLNWERNQAWITPFTPENARPAIYTFSGDVYTGFDIASFNTNQLETLQKSVRILSGLYGMLKPLDLIQAYRLEMGTSISIDSNKNLYDFWQVQLTQALAKELADDEVLINLASQEYSKAINFKELTNPVINPIFKDWKNDKLKIISFYAKKARGLIARYLVENESQSLADILKFDIAGYHYSAEHTTDEFSPVFIR